MKNLHFLSHGDKEILKNARETVLLADFLMQFVGNRVRFTTDHFAFAIEANPHLLKIAIGNILNNACKYSGHGIGLSLSMRILRSYGAEITITSEVGKGTTVEIEFP